MLNFPLRARTLHLPKGRCFLRADQREGQTLPEKKLVTGQLRGQLRHVFSGVGDCERR